MTKTITIKATIHAPIERVWECFTKPNHITKWNFASDDWECPSAENDLRVGGKIKSRMQAKDKSSGFDFEGTYTNVKKHELIEYDIADGRHVEVKFTSQGNSVEVISTFEAENVYSEEQQRSGWQAILDNFKKHVEKTK